VADAIEAEGVARAADTLAGVDWAGLRRLDKARGGLRPWWCGGERAAEEEEDHHGRLEEDHHGRQHSQRSPTNNTQGTGTGWKMPPSGSRPSPEKDLEWDDADVEGQFRFLQRLWRLVESASSTLTSLDKTDLPTDLTEQEANVRRALHLAIDAVSEDLDDEIQLNTAISELMKLSNTITASQPDRLCPAILQEVMSGLIRLLAPFAPHIAEELWNRLGGQGSVHHQSWPSVDPSALIQDTISIVIQVKGKVRGSMQVPAKADKETLESMALSSDVARKWLEGTQPKRVIVVPGRLVNLVP
jgi:leucyl-tRNA synthetase